VRLIECCKDEEDCDDVLRLSPLTGSQSRWNDPPCSQEIPLARKVVVASHEPDKTPFHQLRAAALAYMDWATQPIRFGSYAGAVLEFASLCSKAGARYPTLASSNAQRTEPCRD